jgi:hypothetical protein
LCLNYCVWRNPNGSQPLRDPIRNSRGAKKDRQPFLAGSLKAPFGAGGDMN